MRRFYILFMLLAVILGGCGKKASDEIDFGTVEDSIYQNQYFGLSLEVPSGWTVQDQEAQKRIMELGGDIVAGEDKNLSAVIKASKLQTVNLLSVAKHPIGAPVDYNPSMMCIAEKVSHAAGIKRGSDYHFHSKKLLQSGQLKVSFPEGIYPEQIDGIGFDVMTVQISFGGVTVMQKQYVTIMKGYALLMVISYVTPEEEAELVETLRSARF